MVAIGTQIVVFSIGILLSYWFFAPTSQVQQMLDDDYDYIIVGGGSAGALVAARLSENTDKKVLLLEAGGEENSHPDSQIPFTFGSLLLSHMDWKYRTVPQKNACLSYIEEQSRWSRGKLLGGTGILNAMQYVRGSRYDYDGWAALGNPGWSYDDMLPYFKKSENQLNPDYRKDGRYHGTTGPMAVSTKSLKEVSDAYMIEAFKDIGYDAPIDCNGEKQIGFSPSQVTVGRNGMRCSSASCFLRPVMDRENLHVATFAHVTKVLIDKTTKTAKYVEFMRNNNLQTVSASKEIILSAGAIGSPQILMLSGVGPKQQLENLGIEVIADLPVGENLQDHIFTPVSLISDEIIGVDENMTNSYMVRLQHLLFGTGLLSHTIIDGNAFVHVVHQPKDDKRPYLQIMVKGIMPTLGLSVTGTKPEVFNAMYGSKKGKGTGITMYSTLLQPRSVGSVRLKSANPFDHPLIDPNYLAEKQDVDVILDGIKIIRSLLKTKSFRRYGIKGNPHLHPVCAQQGDDNSDIYWECLIRHLTQTFFHPTGTCKMGPASDKGAVVDPQLRVYGIKSLRVVDASIMPVITSGPTNAPTVAIAEKAADLIKGNIHQ